MKAITIILAILLLGLVVTAGFFYNQNRAGRQELAALQNENAELVTRAQTLEARVAGLSQQLADTIAQSSKAKEEEIQRLNSAHEQLIKELQVEMALLHES